MNSLLSEIEVSNIVPKSMEAAFISMFKEKSLRFQETIIKETIIELCKNDSFQKDYINFSLNLITFKLNEKIKRPDQIDFFPEASSVNVVSKNNGDYFFPKLINKSHLPYDLVSGEHTHPNYAFTMPRSLFDVRNLFMLDPEFKRFVETEIKPFLDLHTEKFIYILKKTFPQVSNHWIDSSLYGAISKTKIALFGGNLIKYDYNWCRFFFNFKTLEILNKK